MMTLKMAVYSAICLHFLRRLHLKLVKDFELDIPLLSNDCEGCYCVVVGSCPIYASYQKPFARELATKIKRRIPGAQVMIIEDETLDSDFELENTGLGASDIRVLRETMQEFYEAV